MAAIIAVLHKLGKLRRQQDDDGETDMMSKIPIPSERIQDLNVDLFMRRQNLFL